MTTTPVILGNVVLSNGNLAVLAGNQYETTNNSNNYYGFDDLQVAILSNSTPLTLNQTIGNLSFASSGDSPNQSVSNSAGNGTTGGGTIAALPGGGMAVLTWGGSNLNYDLQILNNAGTVTTAPFVVHSQVITTGDNPGNPLGAVAAWSGGIVVAYSTDNETADYFQRYTLAGATVGSPVEFASISGAMGSTGWNGTMAVDSSGNVIFGFGASDIYTDGAYKMYSSTNTVLNTSDAVGYDANIDAHAVAQQGLGGPTFAPLSGGGFATVGYTAVGSYDSTTGTFPNFTMNIQTVSTAGAITTQDSVTNAVAANYSASVSVNWISVLPDGTVEFQEARDNTYYHDANVADSYTVAGGLDRGGVTLPLPDGNTSFYLPPVAGPGNNVVGVIVNASGQLGSEGLSVAAPSISGAVAGQTTTDEATVTPFAAVSITDPNVGQTETITITLSHAGASTDADGTLSGAGLSKTGTGAYTLSSGTPSAVTTELEGLVFTPTAHQVAPGGLVTTTFTITATDTAGGTSSNSSATVGATAVNDPPVITGATAGQTTTDETTISPFAGVAISDVDFGQIETVTITLSTPLNGTLSSSAAGSYDNATGLYSVTGTDAAVTAAVDGLVFTPTAHQVAPGGLVTTTFAIKATDTAGGTSSNSSATVVATAVNDPPVIAGATAGQSTTDEAAISPFAGVAISDVDAGQTETVAITLSNPINGTLSNVGAGSYDSATGLYSVTGTDAAVTAAVDGLVFTPTAHQVAPGGLVTTTFAIKATDTAGGTSSNSSASVVATAVNDPPVITGATAGQSTTDEAAISPFTGVAISDVDFGQTETVAITLSNPLNGTLSNVGAGSYDGATGLYSVTGTDAAVTTAIDGLVFTPTAHQVAPGGLVTTTFAIKATDTAGGTSSNSSATVVATAVNDPPVIAGATAGQSTTDEAAISPFAGVAISDVDAGQTETVAITLSNPINGTLSNVGAGSYDSATGLYSVTGTDAAVTAAVDGLVFTPTAHQVAPGGLVTTTFAIKATDTAGGTSSNSSASVVATAVNDPPVIAGATAGQSTTDEAAISPFTGVAISDVDFGQTETVAITLSNPLNGTLSNVGAGSYDGATGLYSVTGTDAAVTAAVDGLVFTPTAHQVAPGGLVTTTFAIKATDTAGGTSSNSSATVVATAVNDPPVIAGATAGQSTTDEAAISPFAGVAISDVDAGQTETVAITLSNPINGTLSNVGAGSYDSATGLYSVTGTDAAVTAAVDGLVFTPTAHQVAPGGLVTTTFAIKATDTAGGTSSNSSASVVATAVNDPPVITGATAGQSTTDEAAISPFTGVAISDVDFGQTETVAITLSNPLNGTLSNVGAGSYDGATGLYSVTGTDAAVTAAVDGLVFTPTAHQVAPGGLVTTAFTITATDTAGGTSSNSSASVVATAVNDPPVIAGATAGQSTTDEAAISPFAGVAISDVDAGQTETVAITLSNPINGTLSNVGAGSYDSATGLYSVTGTDAAVTAAVDGLVFTPTAHQVAPGGLVTTTFAIKATDTAGGTSSNSSASVVATAVNDPPVITGATAGQSTTDEAAISPFTGVAISDVDFGQTETVAITLSNPLNGTLSNVGAGSYDGATGLYSVTGTDAAVTAAVDGLVFTPTAHQVAPGGLVTTAFTITATDTAGGTSSNSSASVVATAVNDPPVIAGATAGQSTTDEATISPFTGVAISDVDAGQTETVAITLSNPINGTLSNVGAGSYDSATGLYSVTGTDAAVTAAVDGLVFTPTAHQVAPGGLVTTTFAIKATDTAGGTSSNSSASVVATAVNDPPVITGATAGQSTTDEATISPFTGVAISDVDAGQTETLTITLSGAGGTLAGSGLAGGNGGYTLSGTAAAVTAELDALSFAATAGLPGTSGTTTFTLSDTSSAYATPAVNSVTTVTDVDASGTGWGDVHMVTFQGLNYDFQAVGDFTLVKGTTSADPFDVQIETSPWASMISVTTEIAAQVGGNAVQFDLDGTVKLNGAVDTSLGSINAVQAIDGGTITRTSANAYVVDWASGESLTVTNTGAYFNETVTLSAKDGPGSVQGLLGSNTSQATDIQLANGAVLNAPTDSQLLGVYAESWSVADSASLLNDNTSLPLAMSNDGNAATPFNGRSFIDLAGLNPAGATLGFQENAAGAFGTLSIQNGAQQTSMTLLGQYAAAGFGIASDGHGGTIVDYTPPKVTMLG